MYIPDKSVFQPSDQSLNKWLACRKPTLRIGGAPMPGFFSDTGNASDNGWFWVGFIGELIGLFTTIYAGFNSGGIFIPLAILAIVMFVFCDYFFAVKLHRNKARDCRIQSERVLAGDDRKALVDLEIKLGSGRFVDFLLQAGIFAIALLKIFGILVLGVFNNIALYFPFAVIYLIVAYVHINHTGYFFAYVDTERAFSQEHKRLASGQFDAHEAKEAVATPLPLRDLPIKHNPHVIEADATPNSYMIVAKGVLTDDDILNLIDGQDDSNREALFRACRKLQLENLAQNN